MNINMQRAGRICLCRREGGHPWSDGWREWGSKCGMKLIIVTNVFVKKISSINHKKSPYIQLPSLTLEESAKATNDQESIIRLLKFRYKFLFSERETKRKVS